jgi:hypothetical protein
VSRVCVVAVRYFIVYRLYKEMARMHAHNIWNLVRLFTAFRFTDARSDFSSYHRYFKVRQDFTLHCSEFVLYSLQQQKRLRAGPLVKTVKLYASSIRLRKAVPNEQHGSQPIRVLVRVILR